MKNIRIIRAKYVVDTENRRHGKSVMCLDTGEVFTSAKECSDVKHMPYANFSLKLRNGKEAVDGKLYCYVGELPYYAEEIRQRIYTKAKTEYDAALLTIASYKHMF